MAGINLFAGVGFSLHGARCFSRQAAFPILKGHLYSFCARRIHQEKGSQVMAAIRSRGQQRHELKLVSIYVRLNHRLAQAQPLPGHPDFVFHRARLAISLTVVFGTAAVGTAAGQSHEAATGGPNDRNMREIGPW